MVSQDDSSRGSHLQSPLGKYSSEGVDVVSDEVASVGAMGWFRRRRNLGLRPLSELHDEFAKRPDAEELLADAEEALTYRERNDAGYVKQHAAEA